MRGAWGAKAGCKVLQTHSKQLQKAIPAGWRASCMIIAQGTTRQIKNYPSEEFQVSVLEKNDPWFREIHVVKMFWMLYPIHVTWLNLWVVILNSIVFRIDIDFYRSTILWKHMYFILQYTDSFTLFLNFRRQQINFCPYLLQEVLLRCACFQ